MLMFSQSIAKQVVAPDRKLCGTVQDSILLRYVVELPTHTTCYLYSNEQLGVQISIEKIIAI